MKIFILIVSLATFFSQLFDFCSNEEYLSLEKDRCLTIQGCCFARIADEFGNITNCFKKLDRDGNVSCQIYKNVTKSFGNRLDECFCTSLTFS
jgi:hypothetical protein